MLAPPTCAREAALKAEVEAVDAAEEVEGVVDDARVEEPVTEAETELARVEDPGTEAEPDPDTDLEARLANFEEPTEGRRLTRRRNQTTQTQNH